MMSACDSYQPSEPAQIPVYPYYKIFALNLTIRINQEKST